jgi:RNA polymerase sigma factor (sigma-70 family)
MNDAELLREISSGRSEEAFRSLIDRYVKMVYASCCRQLENREMAEDATQAVFVLLSQKAGAVRHSNLAGWLLTTARYTCAKMRKMEQRRVRRETAAAMERSHSCESGENELLAVLDDGLARLRGSDRQAIALRYFQERSLGEVGESLGISEEAARKRVNRGVEKLRNFFARKGINISTGVLPAMLAQQQGTMTAEAQASVTRGILSLYHGGGATSAMAALVKGTDVMMQLRLPH